MDRIRIGSALIASALLWGLYQGVPLHEPVLRWSVLKETASAVFVYAMVGGGPFIALALLCEHVADRLNAR